MLTFSVLREERLSEEVIKYGKRDTKSESMSYDAREKFSPK
jgi:hypothetical protein